MKELVKLFEDLQIDGAHLEYSRGNRNREVRLEIWRRQEDRRIKRVDWVCSTEFIKDSAIPAEYVVRNQWRGKGD